MKKVFSLGLRIWQSPVAILSVSNLLSQMILFAFTFVYAKLFAPDVFGAANIFLFPIQTLSVAAAARYDIALANAKANRVAARIAMIAFRIVLVCTIGVALIVALIGGLTGANEIWPQSLLVPLGVLVIGMFQIANYWVTRNSEFRLIAAARLFQAVVGAITPVILYAFGYGVPAIVMGAILARSAGLFVFLCSKDMLHQFRVALARGARVPLLPLMHKFRSFPFFSMPQALVNAAALAAGPFIVSLFINTDAGGQFWMADRIMLSGMAVVGASFGQVLLGRCKGLTQPEAITEYVLESHQSMLSLGPSLIATIAFVLFFFAQDALGENWDQVGMFALILMMSATMQLLASPLTVVVGLLGKNRENLYIHTGLFLGRTLPLIAMCLLFPAQAIFAYAFLSAIGYGLYLVWLLKISGVSKQAYFARFSKPLGLSIAVMVLVNVICLSR